jgi:hypothetical protein
MALPISKGCLTAFRTNISSQSGAHKLDVDMREGGEEREGEKKRGRDEGTVSQERGEEREERREEKEMKLVVMTERVDVSLPSQLFGVSEGKFSLSPFLSSIFFLSSSLPLLLSSPPLLLSSSLSNPQTLRCESALSR